MATISPGTNLAVTETEPVVRDPYGFNK